MRENTHNVSYVLCVIDGQLDVEHAAVLAALLCNLALEIIINLICSGHIAQLDDSRLLHKH
jgi:hypothetical protein